MTVCRGISIFFVMVLLVGGCSMEKLTQQQVHRAYQRALEATETTAYDGWQEKPEQLSAAIEKLQQYYGDVTARKVQTMTAEVYSENAFLCDTLHIANGADEIRDYFTATARRVKKMEVEILDYSVSGREVYTRWSMTIQSDELADGKPVTSFGISHFRFDRQGMVVLHQDFWDASAGFFEHLPVLGGAIQRIRGNL